MTDLAESLVGRGIQVTALAGRGRYNGIAGGTRLAPREDYRGVRVERAPATNFGKTSVAGRLADYLTFYCGAAWKLITLPRHDVVMALTTPPLIGLLALAACRLKGMKMVALVQDIYPDVGVALGAFKEKSFSTRALDKLNRTVLSGADRIIVLGECMRERVAAKMSGRRGDGDALDRIDVIHNWADGEKIRPLTERERNAFAEEHDLAGKFVIQFSGNMGRVNDFDTPLEAARLLNDEGRTDILFLFIGDGAKAVEIADYVRRHKLTNVRLLPYQPRETLLYSLAAGHAHLVTLAQGLAGLSVPSKTYGVLAAGRPVLFVGDPRSDIARLVAEHHCGAVIPMGEAAQLAKVILTWAAAPALTAKMGMDARELFLRRFDRPHAVEAYARSLSKCLGSAPFADGRGRSGDDDMVEDDSGGGIGDAATQAKTMRGERKLI